ncbi:hypothetical protein BC835DRAFT_1410075 [Cytidiella melzeri]|nr:hypothetical protein BC835DRAFT_1410075 [Cytidiella melzeri]
MSELQIATTNWAVPRTGNTSYMPSHDACAPPARRDPVHLPDEVLDMIIFEAVGPKVPYEFNTVRQDRQTYSIVSRRWRNIVLPYMFTRIIIRDPEGFLQFVIHAPSIAFNVRHIDILNLDSTLDVVVLDSLLTHLPRLRSMRIEGVALGNSAGQPRQYKNHTVQRVLCDSFQGCKPAETRYDQLLDFLALFSDIEDLKVDIHDYRLNFAHDSEGLREVAEKVVPFAVAAARIGHSQVRSLQIEWGPRLHCFLLSFLVEIDAFRHLTSLALYVDSSSGLDRLNALLCVVGPTLKSLAICLRWASYRYSLERKIFIGKIRPGITACSVLEEFMFAMNVFIGLYVHPVPAITAHEDRGQPDASWLTALDLVELLPTDSLRHLSLDIGMPHNAHDDLHSLSWPALRAACRRSTNIQAIKVALHKMHKQNSRREGCVLYEMQEFRELLGPSESRTFSPDEGDMSCKDQECRRFQLVQGSGRE